MASNSIRRYALTGCFVMLASCGGTPANRAPTAPSPAVVPQNFMLTGTLLLTAAGGTRGMAGKLEVDINDGFNRGFERRVVETTPDGRYTVSDLSPGTLVNVRQYEFLGVPTAHTQPCAAWAMMDATKVVDFEVVAAGERQTIRGSPILSGTVHFPSNRHGYSIRARLPRLIRRCCTVGPIR